MKHHRQDTDNVHPGGEQDLYQAILKLRTLEDCRRFFGDLCTPAELQAICDRWRVVGLLEQNLPYREIYARTGVSVTTVGRVARFLSQGNGGYRLAIDRLKRSRRA